MTQNSKTLVDHIYVSENRNVIETCVPNSNISNHYPVCLTWIKKGAKIHKIGHKTIKYRYFPHFNEQLFLNDLSLSPLAIVYNITEPTEALDFWLDTCNTIYDKHAPYKQKRARSFLNQNGLLKNNRRQFTLEISSRNMANTKSQIN